MRARICRTSEELAAVVPEWERLARRSEPNVFYEPALLLPAFKYLKNKDKPFVVLIYDEGASRDLLGLFPMVARSSYQRFPLRHLANWRYVHAFYCAPLIVRGREKQVLNLLLDELRTSYPRYRTYGFELLDRNSALFDAISAAAGRSIFVESYERAELDIRNSDPATLMKPSHRKDLRRRERKLAQSGLLSVSVNEADESFDGWLADFTSLEQSGWKGKNGTAINCTESDRMFFWEALGNARNAGKLKVTSLRLDGDLIASTCDLTSGDRSYAFKITYDELHRRLSPGILVVLKHIESLKNDGDLHWADSCAQEGSEMANRVYPGRRVVARVTFSTVRSFGGYIINRMLPAFVALKDRLKRHAAPVEPN